jgi:hypothetical protein
MFQRRAQSLQGGIESSGEQHILTVLRFHEVRLGKIEKYLINTNKQLELLTKQRRTTGNTKLKSTNNTDSFMLLKTMMTNLTEQVEISQSFMKEIKEVVSKIKVQQVSKVANKKKESLLKSTVSSSECDIDSKVLKLERNIAKASLFSIGMEPTEIRIDEYVARNRRERKRILNNLDTQSFEKKVTNRVVKSEKEDSDLEEETEEETSEEEAIGNNQVMAASIVDDEVLENDIGKLTNLKSHIKEEVQGVVDKIPVIIKPRKKRRGRPKKT